MNVMPITDEPAVATAGEPLAPGMRRATRDELVAAIRNVYDPEIPVNIYDLGLVYGLDIDETDGSVSIAMTLTAPSCPVAGELPQQVAEVVATVPGTGVVSVALVWDPPWTMEQLSEDAKLLLNL
jgi:FeS assembly SUF system protein